MSRQLTLGAAINEAIHIAMQAHAGRFVVCS